jgi:hypothetical protein
VFGLNRERRADKVTEALKSAVSLADDVLRDSKLHGDIRSAADHSSVVAARVQKDLGSVAFVTRLIEDRKLRKHLKALIEDLDSAGARIRKKRSHRLRNVLLIAGVGSLVVAVPDVRRWVSAHVHVGDNGASETIATAT